MSSFLTISYLFICLLGVLNADEKKYSDKDNVIVYVNKVGPYSNPQETYHYYSLPVCRPPKIVSKDLTLGEVLSGDRMAHSLYDVKFNEEINNKQLCSLTLNSDELNSLRVAIEEFYYFEFVIDDIPLRGFVGQVEETNLFPHKHHIYVYTHHHFDFHVNDNQIIYVNISTKDHPPTSLDDDSVTSLKLEFTYSAKWHRTETRYKDRAKYIANTGFFPETLEIHWLSVINSMVLVFLLMGFVVIILSRILKHDLNRMSDEDDDGSPEEENGWKIIHTDVFRFPVNRELFCSVLGVGCQFLSIFTGILIFAVCGMFTVHRHGSLMASAVILYAFTSCVAGYMSGRMYRQLQGEHWTWNIILTANLFTVPFFLIWSVINTVAWIHGTTQALPYTTVLILAFMWLFVGFPLTVLGGIFGKNWTANFDAPCRTKNIAREIPQVAWYRTSFVRMLVGGFLPFSAISVELYYIFSTFWGREQYMLYGILTIVFIILLSVTACISIALTYFQLAAEDYRWWWQSIVTSGSTGLFVFLYAVFFYFNRSKMRGALQTLQFFGYTSIACYVFFLMLGTVGFFSSLRFIRYIYVNIKMD
ncbi:unnamed protein product [Rotaria magnacalcarata]|uniref:Transmembrane 9 superfamily member n=1 Tax=Rotaria magnacalcarata TaxID=392030 RepID=A0A814GSL7_9BILA|nr:unnamed protein product [Rotaria magnacalcarata]CAF1634833.1 unnamed protein product [Rotaria magnacalcarata]CAF1917590.1 unnamed protein product [Rotaria magnacalcarata]CAF1940036.1 unnamed protein product [Rotaria magnacalcarata]CAF2086142.1 unnamed protein product [Rotaria magnacalcarata]